MLTQQIDIGMHLLCICHIRTAHDNGSCVFNLVIEKFTEVLHIHFALGGIHDRHGTVQLYIQIFCNVANRIHNIGKLADSGRLDDDALRFVFGQHLLQRLTEISYQRATDTARIHLTDLDTGIFQKASVNSDLTKFVLDQNNLLTLNCFL